MDGELVHSSPMLSVQVLMGYINCTSCMPSCMQGEPWPVVVQIASGAEMLRLVVTDGGDGHAIDYVDFVQAGFVRRGTAAGDQLCAGGV